MNKLASTIIVDAESSLNHIDFSQLHNKKILITGASGLVGTYFLASIVSIIKKSTVSPIVYAVSQSVPEKYWEEIAGAGQCTILKGDLCDDNFVKSIPKVDFIIHAAGYGQPGKFMATPQKTIKLNTTVTQILLEKLNTKGKFLFISTSEVYSGLSNPPFNEEQIGTTNTDHPRSCYIEAKRCGEAIMSVARSQGIEAKSARLSLAYGPGTKKDDARAINSFIYRALTEHSIAMLDSGAAHRTYCYITDAVKMMWNIILNGKDSLYNVGGVSETTIADLARKIGEMTGATVQIPAAKEQALIGAPADVVLDLEKIRKEFGINDFISLDEGLKRTISWQKQYHIL